MVGDARIVALGEATHGTREFFQLKHRMLEFLATEMGFTIFSIEANMPEAYRLNDYVLHGKGDPKALLAGMYFWTWNTEEVLAMIEWMREFNKSGKARLQFTGFDMQYPGVASANVREFVEQYDSGYLESLRAAIDQVNRAQQSANGPTFGVATGRFPADVAAGHKIRFSGYIRTEGVTGAAAGLWWRADGADKNVLAFDNMQARGPKGTTDWKQYRIELTIPKETVNINFGAILPGGGTAWFDTLTVDIDGVPWDSAGSVDLDFEQAGKGFYLGGRGYSVKSDDQVFHTGAHSLRMTRTGPAAENPPEPTAVAAAWDQVMQHLEQSREAYGKQGADSARIDWAIQNARVTRQCAGTWANQSTRDQNMAQNVAWILNQNPGAKIVLWAHNGHVGAQSRVGGAHSMGFHLRQQYGKQMMTFGFGFNRGSFQAMGGAKGLQNFTVGAAPEGSRDAALAAAGMPVLALDLRRLPVAGPVAEWWNQPHKTREIGAMGGMGDAGYLFDEVAPQLYDALLFVENTTAAQPVAKK